MSSPSALSEPLLQQQTEEGDVAPAAAAENGESGGGPVASDVENGAAPSGTPHVRQHGSYWEIFKAFALLGWTAFGGPTAHIAFFHKTFVEQKGWMSEDVFVELLAICQAMPGPTSTQMSFAMGILQRGVRGGLFSGALFQYPGLLIMSAVGFGAAKWLVTPTPLLQGCSAGLAAVAVALVAEAAVGLSTRVCKTAVTQSLCAVAAAITFYHQSQLIFPLLMVAGAVITTATSSTSAAPVASDDVMTLGLSRLGGGLLLLAWLLTLIASVVAVNFVSYAKSPWIHWFEAFYLTGSVTYGGGQVMLPLLEHVVVQPGNQSWVSEQQFLTGLALAQAMPGPLFNFSAYLGAIIGGIPGIAACWLGLFGPGVAIIFGILPFWGQFRKWDVYRRAMPGLNSTAIGFIFASVFSMGIKALNTSPFPTASISIGVIGFWSTTILKIPAPVAVLGGGVLGVGARFFDLH